MKIEKRGVRITAVPGLESITVEQDTYSTGGVHILLKGLSVNQREFERGTSYGIKELGELIEALQAAQQEAQQMAGMPSFVKDDEGPWERLEDIPEHITRIYDKENDSWGVQELRDETEEIQRKYAPYRLYR
jgi:hypothetical protein